MMNTLTSDVTVSIAAFHSFGPFCMRQGRGQHMLEWYRLFLESLQPSKDTEIMLSIKSQANMTQCHWIASCLSPRTESSVPTVLM
eukprot:1085407-Amphidinium_carterae.1